jgi:hypothetical protein
MQAWIAELIGAGVVVLVQLLTAAYIYGQLTRDVKSNSEATKGIGHRLMNVETVLSGTGGHGERLTALEAWRIEQRAKGASQ